MSARASFCLLCLAAAVALACEGEPGAPDGSLDAALDPDAGAAGPARALADYATNGVWTAPWPDERLRTDAGVVDLSTFPPGRGVRIATQLLALLEDADGFGTSSSVYFPMSAPLDPSSLPSVHESLLDEASVYLVDVDPASPDRGARFPLDVVFDADPGPFAVPNVLAALPYQGRPLHPERLYAAVVTTRVRGADGAALGVAPETAAVLAGERPTGMREAAFEAHRTALETVEDDVAAMAVFRTWDPADALRRAREQVIATPPPTPTAFTLAETHEGFCAFRATVDMPVFQAGEAPYAAEGGGWVWEDGRLVVQRGATSTLWVTVPRATMPAEGFPVAVFVRTGGGGDRPLLDRGPRASAGGPDTPGTGPAVHLAAAGRVGVSVDGPLGGLRNTGGWDEQFAIFNINNPEGLRDTIRQSALELILLAHMLPTLELDASACEGFVGPAQLTLDTRSTALMGHSMGATIAPLVVALEPLYRALILSGAGASWIHNVMEKESPIHVRPAAEALLRYTARGRTLTRHDPVLSLLQWVGEVADPQVYAASVITAEQPRHVLMFQGILDTYIPPPVANALSLALGLDLAGGDLDAAFADRFVPLSAVIDLAGRDALSLPVTGNAMGGASTAVVVQHDEDGVEDGHEVVFQRPEPPRQYRCFLQSLDPSAAPTVVARDDGCP